MSDCPRPMTGRERREYDASRAGKAFINADLSCRFCGNNIEVSTDRDDPGFGDIECVQCAARWDGRTGALQWSNVAPVTTDLVPDQTADRAAIERVRARLDESDLLVLRMEAERDKLRETAREYLAETEGRAVTFREGMARAALVRALDGDAGEEER